MLSDFRFAFRQLRAQPGFTILAALSLALGIGLVATQFSLIDGILLRGIPAPDAHRVMHVARLHPQEGHRGLWEGVPWRDFLAFRDRQGVFEELAGTNVLGLNLTGNGRLPTHHPGALASAELLGIVGAQPMLGRWFTPEEDRPGQPTLVVLSHELWQEEFAADPGVLGQPLTVNGFAGTIVGVMPPRFSFPANQRLWVNLRAEPNDPRFNQIDRVEMFGRLRPGVTPEQARAEFDTLAATLVTEWPDTNQGYTRMSVQTIPYAYSGAGTRPILYLMLAMTLFILGLACVNVANMLLGRAARRTRELAVRAAVGASRVRLVRQLLAESLVLAGLGAAAGLFFARIGVDLLQTHLASLPYVPGWFEFRLDLRVAGVAVGVTVLAGVLAGIVPSWRASRVDLNTALKDDSRAASGLGLGALSRWLVTAQIAFSTALLISACVLAWTVFQTRQANLQYDPARLLTGRVELHHSTHPQVEDRAGFFRELVARLGEVPGVESVAVTSRNFIGNGVATQVAPEGVVYAHDNDRPTVWLEVVSTDYFKLIGVSARTGRLFDSREQSLAFRSAVINESFARRFFAGTDPVGRRFRSNQTEDHWVNVIGVVPDLQMQGIFAPEDVERAGFYLVQDQMGWGWLDLFVRTRGDPLALVTPLREAIARLDPDQPIHSVGTLESTTALMVRGFSIIGVMAAVFAGITLFLGAVGVYGVTSLAVSRRTREFGLRMALGATVGQVLRLVLAQGGRQIGLGLGAGLLGAFLITRPLQSVLTGGMMNNPLVYAAVAAVITLVALVALWIPARRATHIDPMVALRNE